MTPLGISFNTRTITKNFKKIEFFRIFKFFLTLTLITKKLQKIQKRVVAHSKELLNSYRSTTKPSKSAQYRKSYDPSKFKKRA